MKFIIGGRMGDLIHMLYVVKNTPGKHDLYITDRRDLHSDGFLYSLDKTIEELRPVLMTQDYVNSIQPYEGDVTENTEIKEGVFVNLNMWRRYAYSASWTNLLAKVFNVPVNGEPWMQWLGWNWDFELKTVIHQSVQPARAGNWSGLLPNEDEVIFLGTREEFKSFHPPGMWDHCEPTKIEHYFTAIKTCAKFICNQSLPLAIAHALDVPRIGLLNPVDCKAYQGEELIFKKFSYVL
jgi:hypothetical protein